MKFNKKLGYLKGLADGLSLDDSSKESKILLAMIDLLDELCEELEDVIGNVEELEDDFEDLNDELETLNEAVEEIYEEQSEMFSNLDCDCGDEDCDCDDDDEDEYELDCPSCDHSVVITGEMIDAGFVICPNCKEKLGFDVACNCDCENKECSDCDKE